MSEGKRDDKAPSALIEEIKDGNGKVWGTVTLDSKKFSTGSVGFYGNGKLTNPDNLEARYQIGFNLTLVGSKPEKG
jgi:hypothetical protein